MIERYQDQKVAEIWNRVAEVGRWFQVEVEHMRTLRGDTAAKHLLQVGGPCPVQVDDFEQHTRHEVAAFLLALDSRIQNNLEYWAEIGDTELVERCKELRQWLHYGLTSSDVVDTGLGMTLGQTHQYLCEQVAAVTRTLNQLAGLLSERVVIGRTHGQLAAPMSAGWRWQVLYENLVTQLDNLHGAGADLAVGKLSGPVGFDGDQGGEEATLTRLGVEAIPSTQIVPRDRLAHWVHCLSQIASTCEAVATQIWLLSQQEIAEVVERPAPLQVGSSAMPHKRNPVRSENIRGLARLARGYAEMLQGGIVQWGEHDLAHSSVERVALPDLCHVMATILSRTARLLTDLEFRRSDSPREYRDSHALLMEAQRAGEPYVEAHARLMRDSYLGGKIPLPADAGLHDPSEGRYNSE